MRRYGFAPDALIETLHSVQEAFGYIDHDALRFIAQGLQLPPSRVLGAATFYNYFTMKPQGLHTCVVCMGTACYIKGGNIILHEMEQKTGVKAGETTPDKAISLVTARCLGACGLAPAVVLDGVVHAQATPETVVARLSEWQHNES
jgi:bidirectional [NiFe] hydrogenase diaphorase subunit